MVVPVLYANFGEQEGFLVVFIVLAVVFAATAAIVALLGQETKGLILG
jgi:hypothetical protein